VNSRDILTSPAASRYDATLMAACGTVFLDTGDFEGAEKALEQSLRFREDNPTRLAYARALAMLGRYAEAAGQAEAVLSRLSRETAEERSMAQDIATLTSEWRSKRDL